MHLVTLDQVQYSTKGKDILHTVDFAISAHEHWVVLGPNAAGKSTLLKIIAGHLLPTHGTANITNLPFTPENLSTIKERVGFLSSSIAEYIPRHYTALDTVLSPAISASATHSAADPSSSTLSPGMSSGAHLGAPAAESTSIVHTPSANEERRFDIARAMQMLGAWGVAALAESPFALLSDGHKRAVLLARAFMTDPELVVLDEPTVSLDIAAKYKMANLLNRHFRNPRAPASISAVHTERILPYVTHALLLKNGHPIAQGPAAQILTDINLSALFDIPMRVTYTDEGFEIRPN